MPAVGELALMANANGGGDGGSGGGGGHGHDENSVVICGFGELGQGLANMLESPLAVRAAALASCIFCTVRRHPWYLNIACMHQQSAPKIRPQLHVQSAVQQNTAPRGIYLLRTRHSPPL